MYRFLFSIMALAIMGCSAVPSQADVNWRYGAKHGWVSEFYSSATPRRNLPVCLASLSSAELDQHRFARISYRHVRRMLSEVAELPDAVPIKLGDRVELWPSACDKGLPSRISKVIPQGTQ